MQKKLTIFDTTLRDGAQSEEISFSIEDKLKILKALDNLGFRYIEAGNPCSNPKDLEFFRSINSNELKHAKLTAFGSTRRPKVQTEDDSNMQVVLKANTPAVAIVGKSWDFHVAKVIKTTLEENTKMIRDTLSLIHI